MDDKNKYNYILVVIVFAQFFCTSLWFAGNSIVPNLIYNFDLAPTALGNITSSVQFGFISGTLLFALYSVADRYSPSKVFLFCAILGAAFNACVGLSFNTFESILILRFLTGFSLAGIYPVGMKIASDYFEKGLGRSLGFLVGALVLGTAFPHLIKYSSSGLPWKAVLYITSALSLLGGLSIYLFVPNGPFRKPSQRVDLSSAFAVFKNKRFRSAAFGYFGHMWELYTFWAFVPVIISAYNHIYDLELPVFLWSFIIIGVGSISCAIGGLISEKIGVRNTALIALSGSGLCCLLAPLVFSQSSATVLIIFLLVWGLLVIADSPLFSTLVAQSAPQENKGTALTITNSIGFAITIVSIQAINYLNLSVNLIYLLPILAVGPILGLIANKTQNEKTPV